MVVQYFGTICAEYFESIFIDCSGYSSLAGVIIFIGCAVMIYFGYYYVRIYSILRFGTLAGFRDVDGEIVKGFP